MFYKDIAKTVNDDCSDMDTSNVIADSTVFGWEVYLATLGVWILVYFIMWKGVNSSSYVVWVTVPLPIFFITEAPSVVIAMMSRLNDRSYLAKVYKFMAFFDLISLTFFEEYLAI